MLWRLVSAGNNMAFPMDARRFNLKSIADSSELISVQLQFKCVYIIYILDFGLNSDIYYMKIEK